jgi:hypothetical protein
MTPVTVRCSTLGRLAAFLLIVLIASPFTAPFSAMSGDLASSPCGPADSLKSEATQADAIAELGFVYIAPSWSVVASPPLAPAPLVEFTHINRVLRL